MKPSRHPFLGTLAAVTAFGVVPFASAASVTWNVAGNGTWDTSTGNWTGGSPTANLYVNGDTANFTNTAGGIINLTGTIAPAATNVSAASGTYTFTGTGITTGTLTKSGAGTLILQNSNSHSGTTTVRGALTINSGGAITGGGGLTVGGSTSPTGTVQYDSAATSTFGAIRVGDGNDGTGNSILNQTAGTINASSLTLNNAFTTAGAGDVNLSGGTMTISGASTISNQAAGDNIFSTFTISGANTIFNANGELRLTGNASSGGVGRNAAGKLVQDGGTVNVAGTNGLVLVQGYSAANTAIRRGQYDLNGGTLNVNKITSTSNAAADAVATFNFNGGTLKPTVSSTTFWVNNAQTTANVQNGGAKIDTGIYNITIGQSLLNFAGATTDSLTKSGVGTLTLTGTNTYTGTTTISTGTLAIGSSGSIANSSQIIMGANTTLDVSAVSFTLGGSNAQTLSGTGTIAGNMTVGANGTLAIGSSPGTMSFANNLGLDTGSISNFEINGFTLGNYDLALAALAGTQTVSLNGGTLNLLFQSGFSTLGTVKIFDFDLYTGSGFTSVASTGLASGYTASFDKLSGIVTVIPEPRAALLGGLGLLALLRRRRF